MSGGGGSSSSSKTTKATIVSNFKGPTGLQKHQLLFIW